MNFRREVSVNMPARPQIALYLQVVNDCGDKI